MKKISLILPFLKILFTKPSVIMKALFHATINYNREQDVKKKYGISTLPQVDLLDLFPAFNVTVEPFTHLYGTSLPIDMGVLKLLAQKFTDCDYLEIGTWRGESMANLAAVCRHCVSVSLSDDGLRQIGFSEKHVQVQRFFSHDLKNVEHIEADSRSFNFGSLGKKFDLIFVDGDHSYEGVKNDSEKMMGLLKDEHSIIVWHDYVAQYELVDYEVLSGILDGVPREQHKHLYHISNTLFCVYMKGDFKTRALDFPTMPDKKFRITIEGKPLR